MANIALNKKILEDWMHPEELTNGNYTDYTGIKGHTATHWPKNLTIDLEDVYEIEMIRFLLWDKDARMYKYRLLTSTDCQNWIVHFDSSDGGYKGWQEFLFEPKVKMRFIRLHCMWNSLNGGFHVVQLQAYDKDPENINANLNNKRIIYSSVDKMQFEQGNGLPLTEQIDSLINDLSSLINKSTLINPAPFNYLINSLRIKTNDLGALERSLDAIRREIINPVQAELSLGNKLGKWGAIVGIAGLVVSIFALLNTVFKWIE